MQRQTSPMKRLLNPFHDVNFDHPVLAREARRIPWLNGRTLLNASLRSIMVTVVVSIVLFCGWMLIQRLQPGFYLYPRWFYNAVQGAMVLLALASVIATLPLDYVSMTTALNSINGEMQAGTWDLLRLTSVREGELVLAKHAGAQLRAWRVTMRVVGLRAAAGVLGLLTVFLERDLRGVFGYSPRGLGDELLYILFSIVPILALFMIFILEPIWRMRAVTALGLAVSARSSDGSGSALLAVGTLMAFWLAQLILAPAALMAIWVLGISTLMLGTYVTCAPATMVIVGFATIAGFYTVLRNWGLRLVARRVVALSA